MVKNSYKIEDSLSAILVYVSLLLCIPDEKSLNVITVFILFIVIFLFSITKSVEELPEFCSFRSTHGLGSARK